MLAFINCFAQEYYIRPKLSNLNLNNFRPEGFRIPTETTNAYGQEIVKLVKQLVILGNADQYEQIETGAMIEALCLLSFGFESDEITEIYSYFKCDEAFIDDIKSYMKQYKKLWIEKVKR